MTAFDLIAHDIPALSVEQTGRDAFHLLSDHHVKHLPVVEGKRLIGIISEEDVFNHKLYEPVSEYNFSMLRRFAVQADDHLFDIMKVMGENRLTVIPVVDAAGDYLGLVSQNTLLRAFANTAAFAEPGGILVLEMDRRDYSMSLIARLVEEEHARLLTSVVTSSVDSDLLEVTLKINREDLTRVAAALERHDFLVKRAFVEDPLASGIQDRYDSLMNYLDM
jgi:acetoin utilization protein AcuB